VPHQVNHRVGGHRHSPPRAVRLRLPVGLVRVAFMGRTSTEDQQDPTISIPRRLRTCRVVLPANAVIVIHFYDVESGRHDLDIRGRGRSHERFDIPVRRDGGIQDLLDRAEHIDRDFDAVICESVERIARRTYFGVHIEYLLERAGVALMAADEPASIRVDRASRATGVLTRRIKQGVAEW
jgi:site-specific DNA recombinase